MDTVVEINQNLYKEAGVALIRSRQSLEKVSTLYRSGQTDKGLRSYMMPQYQRDIIDQLSQETGKSKADVIRTIIDEWVEYNLRVGADQ